MRLSALSLLFVALFYSHLYGLETLTFGPEELATWSYPKGLVEVRPEGTEVFRFEGGFNAMANLDEHSASIIGEHGIRKLWTPSNPDSVGFIADQDPQTW